MRRAAVAQVQNLPHNTAANFIPAAQYKIVPLDSKLELLWGEGEFTEGPAPAAEGVVLFSDIGNRILRYDAGTKKVTVFREPSGRSNGLMFDPRGRLVACEGANGGGRRISITEPDGTVRTLADRYQGRRLNSPNDLAITKTGSIYFTDPRYIGAEPVELRFEGVFLIEPTGTLKLATRDVRKPNGILVAPDNRRVYIADNAAGPQGTHDLVEFTIQGDGTLRRGRKLFAFPNAERGIDGMTLDTNGNIYATHGSGESAGIYVFSPRGEPLALIKLPGAPTNCEFGLGRDKQTLYITAAVDRKPPTGGRPPFGLYKIELAATGHHVFQGLAREKR